MELIGKGPDQKGIVWVAARVPDGMITAHANLSRITTFPLDDPENWLYSPDVISFAIEKRFYKTDSGKPFSYRDAYHPGQGPIAEAGLRRPRLEHLPPLRLPARTSPTPSSAGDEGAEDYPLFVKPDEPLAVHDVMALMRDHYEGTPYDMTKGLDAGPFGSPLRLRDLPFKVDGKGYMWERPISTQQAGFVIVSQSRKGMPDAIGGVTWFTPDEASTSCFTPFYCAIDALPDPVPAGGLQEVRVGLGLVGVEPGLEPLLRPLVTDRSPTSSTPSATQESDLLKMQPVIEEAAAKLASTDPALMNAFLTNYSVSTGEAVFRHWQELAESILTKHVDGYVKDSKGSPRAPGYSTEWLQRGRQAPARPVQASRRTASPSRPIIESARRGQAHENDSRALRRLSCVLLLALGVVGTMLTVAARGSNAPPSRPLAYTGVNLAGADFGPPKRGTPSVYGKDYIYPTAQEFDEFSGKGMNVFRLPFLWERLQPTLRAPFERQELERLETAVRLGVQAGGTVLLDPHNYARYFGKIIGSPEVSQADFADFWKRLAGRFKDSPQVWFGLMNEPHDLPDDQWLGAANAAIAAIRKTGATNLILVPGNSWTGAHSWVGSGNDKTMLRVVDPADHYLFDVHQYLDKDSSGTNAQVVSPTIGSERLREFTAWCRKHHKRAFLGEFGAAANPAGQAAVGRYDLLHGSERRRLDRLHLVGRRPVVGRLHVFDRAEGRARPAADGLALAPSPGCRDRRRRRQ